MNFKLSLIILYLLFFFNCKRVNDKSTHRESPTEATIKYAKGFSIQNYQGFKKLITYTSFQDDTSIKEYYLVPKKKSIPDSLLNKTIIRTPIEKMVVTSTTHIPMLELLEVENTLVGFPNTIYISSKKTRDRIDKGKIKDIGHEQNINTEILLELQPDLVVGFGVNNLNKTYRSIEKMGIPVIFNSDWLEKEPLGRAEWLRFFGALYEKDSLALATFNSISSQYNLIKAKVKYQKKKPTVICSALYQDVWYMPAGQSFLASFLADAQSNYLWRNSKGTGSLTLSIESVLDIGKDAEYWIAPGIFTTTQSLVQDNTLYKDFLAYKNDKLYTYTIKKGATGGVLYFEQANTRPDLVLKDLVKIFHPEVLPDYTLTYYNKMP